MSVEVIKPGAFSIFQDLGRYGQQHLGITPGGAMDDVSHRLANLTVGNNMNEGTLEITLLGPTLKFHQARIISWGGADFSPLLNGVPVPRLEPVSVLPDDILAFGTPHSGLRAYLAVAGGFALQDVMGSVSTYPRVGFGGHEGRALRKADRVPLKPSPKAPTLRNMEKWLSRHPQLQTLSSNSLWVAPQPIRLMPGREWGQFSKQAHRTLFSEPFKLSPASDRMGYRLEGPILERRTSTDMLSEAVAFGTIQVPQDGQAIILMADRQSIGGYPRIAQVASVDLPRLAQLVPGDTLDFAPIDIAAAQALLLERAQAFQAAANWTSNKESSCPT